MDKLEQKCSGLGMRKDFIKNPNKIGTCSNLTEKKKGEMV